MLFLSLHEVGQGSRARNLFRTTEITLAFYPDVLIGNQSTAINKAGYGGALHYRWYRRIRTGDSISTIVMYRGGTSSKGIGATIGYNTTARTSSVSIKSPSLKSLHISVRIRGIGRLDFLTACFFAYRASSTRLARFPRWFASRYDARNESRRRTPVRVY